MATGAKVLVQAASGSTTESRAGSCNVATGSGPWVACRDRTSIWWRCVLLLAGGAAPIAVNSVSVVALFSGSNDAVATDIVAFGLAVGAASIEVVVIPIIALLSRFQDTVTADVCALLLVQLAYPGRITRIWERVGTGRGHTRTCFYSWAGSLSEFVWSVVHNGERVVRTGPVCSARVQFDKVASVASAVLATVCWRPISRIPDRITMNDHIIVAIGPHMLVVKTQRYHV